MMALERREAFFRILVTVIPAVFLGLHCPTLPSAHTQSITRIRITQGFSS